MSISACWELHCTDIFPPECQMPPVFILFTMKRTKCLWESDMFCFCNTNGALRQLLTYTCNPEVSSQREDVGRESEGSKLYQYPGLDWTLGMTGCGWNSMRPRRDKTWVFSSHYTYLFVLIFLLVFINIYCVPGIWDQSVIPQRLLLLGSFCSSGGREIPHDAQQTSKLQGQQWNKKLGRAWGTGHGFTGWAEGQRSSGS